MSSPSWKTQICRWYQNSESIPRGAYKYLRRCLTGIGLLTINLNWSQKHSRRWWSVLDITNLVLCGLQLMVKYKTCQRTGTYVWTALRPKQRNDCTSWKLIYPVLRPYSKSSLTLLLSERSFYLSFPWASFRLFKIGRMLFWFLSIRLLFI